MAVPPDFVAGQVLTAAQMNKIGLWLVKTQTIGTAVSSVAVTSAFSSSYDNYRIIVTGGVASTETYLALTLGASTASYYWGQWGVTYANAGSTVGQANVSSFGRAGFGTTNNLSMTLDVFQPNTTKHTIVANSTVGLPSTTGGGVSFAGYHNVTTAYTDFTITTASGTMTGGEIRVYGYRN